MTKSGYKGISRIDQHSRNTYGWYVRVMFNGKQVSKFFSDKVHGSKKLALDAAVEYRDEAEKPEDREEPGGRRRRHLLPGGAGKPGAPTSLAALP